MDNIERYIKQQLKKYNINYYRLHIDEDEILISIKGNRSDYKKFIEDLRRKHINLRSATYGHWRFRYIR